MVSLEMYFFVACSRWRPKLQWPYSYKKKHAWGMVNLASEEGWLLLRGNKHSNTEFVLLKCAFNRGVASIGIGHIQGTMVIHKTGGGGGGGEVKLYPYEKGEAEKVLAMLKGGGGGREGPLL